jgi:hypothetical protein
LAEWNGNLVTAICVQGDDGLILCEWHSHSNDGNLFLIIFCFGFSWKRFPAKHFSGSVSPRYDECTCKALLKAGANTNAQDNNGQTPGDVAALSSERFPELARVFCADKPSSII